MTRGLRNAEGKPARLGLLVISISSMEKGCDQGGRIGLEAASRLGF